MATHSSSRPHGVRVPNPALFLLVLGTIAGVVFGIGHAMAWVRNTQQGEQGDVGLQRLLDQVAAGHFTPEQVFDPEALAKVKDKEALRYVFVGPPAVRKALQWTTSFKVQGLEQSPMGSASHANWGFYRVKQEASFVLDGAQHKTVTQWVMSAQRTDGAWRIAYAGPKLTQSSVLANDLPGYAPKTHGDVLKLCAMGRAGASNTFDDDAGADVEPPCLLPSGVDSPLIDPAVRDLIGSRVKGVGVPYDDLIDVMWAPGVIIQDDSLPVPLSVLRFRHDGVDYDAAFIPTADNTARLAAVVRA